MARNQEKAQSMLYRFREAQAAELGLGTRGDRRPRMASACKSLRECERWRGELLREISRKVAKIQDAGLSDYEVRDLNDEINKQMREKRHWENQIVALGGANYRRNVAMLDDDGKEVPGTKGYKYFGRAKELPGVRELFQSRKKDEEEDNLALEFYRKFQNQGPSYYGDADETDGSLLAFEQKAQDEEWEDAASELRTTLGLAEDAPIPRPSAISAAAKEGEGDGNTVRATSDADDGDTVMAASDADASARTLASYISFITPEMLMPPKLPTPAETEAILLKLQKEMLQREYFGDD
ncbi:Isy1-like splicing factor [Mycena sanguinolenta]|nr:Isy1-like splicing factor [Mycena sanguinolenta]